VYQRLLHTFLALPKFIPTRYAATSVWFPASLLANLVCPLAFVHPIHSIEATKKHKEGRRMLTTRRLHSANSPTSISYVRVACGGGVQPKHCRLSLKVP